MKIKSMDEFFATPTEKKEFSSMDDYFKSQPPKTEQKGGFFDGLKDRISNVPEPTQRLRDKNLEKPLNANDYRLAGAMSGLFTFGTLDNKLKQEAEERGINPLNVTVASQIGQAGVLGAGYKGATLAAKPILSKLSPMLPKMAVQSGLVAPTTTAARAAKLATSGIVGSGYRGTQSALQGKDTMLKDMATGAAEFGLGDLAFEGALIPALTKIPLKEQARMELLSSGKELIKSSNFKQQEIPKNTKQVMPDLTPPDLSIKARDLTTPKITKQQIAATTLPDTRGQIASKTERKLPTTKQALNKGYTRLSDNLFRMKQFDDYVEKVIGNKLPWSEKSYVHGLNSRGADIIAKTSLEEQLVDSTGNKIGGSLKEITQKIPKGKDVDFFDYLIHKHAPTWMKQGRQVFPEKMNITPEISVAKVAEYEKSNPEFKQLSKDYTNYIQNFMEKWAVDTGLISRDLWENLKKQYPDYIPLQRQLQDIEKGTEGIRKGFANQSSPLKKATGSERPIINPLESTIELVYKTINAAKRNETMGKLINNIKKDPEAFSDWVEIVQGPQQTKEFDNMVNEYGLDQALDMLDLDFVPKKSKDLTKPNIVRGLVNGEAVHVKINDPELLEAVTSLNPRGQNIVIDALGQVTRYMKNLTTGINPVFGLARNIFRDIPTAYIYSKTTNNPITFGKDLVGALVSVFKNDDLYKSFKSVGGGHASSISADRNLLKETKRRLLPGQNLRPKDLFNYGIEGLERLNNAVESAPRLAEFKRATKQTEGIEGKVRGLYEANDVTVNFKRFGNVTKEADKVIPYLNAAFQGIDKLVRTVKDNPVQAGVKAFASVTIPTILLYAINYNNDNYKRLSNFTKDNYFLIPKKDGTFTKIPKPREIGVMFGSDVERFMRSWEEKDKSGFEDYLETIKTNFLLPDRSILAPISDIRANKDFLNRPIVSGSLERLSPALQYDERTSEPAKAIGKALNFSPKKIDYLASSYAGVLGQLGLPAMTKQIGTTAGQRVGEVLKRQVTADPLYNTDSINKFYETKEKLDTAYQDFRQQGEKSKYLNEGFRKAYDQAADNISELNKAIKALERKDMSQEEKDRQIRLYRLQMIKIADSLNKKGKALK